MKINGIATAAPQASYPTEIKLEFKSKLEFDEFVRVLQYARQGLPSYDGRRMLSALYLQALGK